MVPALVAHAEVSIQSVTTSVQGGKEVVRIELSDVLEIQAPLSGFTTKTPARVAVDLPGVTNATGRTSHDMNQGNLRSVVIAQSQDRSRLVLNLKQSVGYRAEVQGKVVLVTLDSQSGTAMTPVAAASAGQAPPPPVPVQTAQLVTPPMGVASDASEPIHFADSINRQSLPLRDIDFRRGRDGAGRVVVELPNTQVGVDIRQQGQSLVVEFLRSKLPDNLRRKLDVTDFGTPVQSVSSSQVGERVRVVVEPRGAWEHSAYQTDTQFVLEVRPLKVDAQKLTPGAGFNGEKLSLNFQSIEVRSLLQVIADFTNFNVVTSDTVTGSVTLRLKDVPWDQALEIILQAKGLGVRKNGNVLLVAPKDELAAKEKLELESKAQVAALEPLRTQAFQLNYTKSEDVAKGLIGQQGNSSGGGSGGAGGPANAMRILSPRGSVISEHRTNQLFVTDIAGKLEEITQLIAKIDVPVRQVMIEARIVEADDSFGRSLGVRLGSSDARGINGGVPGWQVLGGPQVAVGGNYASVGATTLQPNSSATFADTQFVNLPANVANANFGGSAAGTFALSLFSATANRFLNLELSALEAESKGKVVSSPRVITADQVKALIEQGTELPYQAATSSGATSVQFRKANLKLEVTPQITPEGNIILDVDVNKDSVGVQTSAGFAINTKHVKTQVLVENGGTVVIGGIFEVNERDQISKVPLLGDIPYLGELFKSKLRVSNKTELLIFLTPKVITDRNAAAH
ncbi:MAG: type IV pilus secretin PilQ [Leptothrix ochracea]|uniref:type IV pilus secretin PilQ n=1 Tax=Leptothrix ochracea TaxID=735331 RepID=UPI0034E2B068